MKNLYKLIPFALLTVMLFSQNNQGQITGIWEFETITTIYISDSDEESITDKSQSNRETFTFRDDGTFSFRGVYDNVESAGIGLWEISYDLLTLKLNNQKIVSQFEQKNNLLTLFVNEAETDEYYESNSVIKYKSRMISPNAYKNEESSN